MNVDRNIVWKMFKSKCQVYDCRISNLANLSTVWDCWDQITKTQTVEEQNGVNPQGTKLQRTTKCGRHDRNRKQNKSPVTSTDNK